MMRPTERRAPGQPSAGPNTHRAALACAFAAAAALAAAVVGCTGEASDKPAETPPAHVFPDGFLWGTATAGFQVDMGCPTLAAETCEDRASDWYQWVTDPAIVGDPGAFVTGEPLARSPGMWELYDADFGRAADELHNNAIRVSLEWSRLFPDGAAKDAQSVDELAALVDTAARDHYRAIFAAARARGLRLLVTLNHYTLPLWLHDGAACHKDLDTCAAKGWVDKDTIVPAIARYAGYCARTFGDQVDLWATLNEPFAVVLSGYLLPSKDRTNPPGLYLRWKVGVDVAFNMMEAHARMYDAIHAEDTVIADGGAAAAEVGIVPNLVAMQPKDPSNPDDVVAAEHLAHIYNRIFLEATVYGKLDRDLDGVFEETRADMAGRMDWIGINYYTRIFAKKTPIPGGSALFPYLDSSPDLDAGVWLDYPEGIGEVVRWASDSYHLPIIITENGTAKPKDTAWEDFLAPHLRALHGALAHPGVELRGYFYWSLLDNYEWNHGMSMRFGLYAVDDAAPSKPRTRTTLAEHYGEVARRNGLD